MPKPETNLTTAIHRWVLTLVQTGELRGGKVLKIHGNQYQEVGTPDLLISVSSGKHTAVMFVECKVPGGKLESIQQTRLQQWAQAGMATAVVWSLEGFKQFYNDVLWRMDADYSGFYGEYGAVAPPT